MAPLTVGIYVESFHKLPRSSTPHAGSIFWWEGGSKPPSKLPLIIFLFVQPGCIVTANLVQKKSFLTLTSALMFSDFNKLLCYQIQYQTTQLSIKIMRYSSMIYNSPRSLSSIWDRKGLEEGSTVDFPPYNINSLVCDYAWYQSLP